MTDHRSVAVAAARDAGGVLLGLFNKPQSYKMKNERDIQIDADLKSEQVIKNKIRSAFPDHGIFAEESGKEREDSEYQWVIDPLDGTINYARGIEEYAVSIALCKEDKILLGVVYQPALDRMLVAEAGEGAYLNDTRLVITGETELSKCLAATDNTSNLVARRQNFELLTRVADSVRHVRIFGSASLHLARIAQGQIDFYYKTRFNYWDVAAGALIVSESGGVVSDFLGQPLTPESKSILAATKMIHSAAVNLLVP